MFRGHGRGPKDAAAAAAGNPGRSRERGRSGTAPDVAPVDVLMFYIYTRHSCARCRGLYDERKYKFLLFILPEVYMRFRGKSDTRSVFCDHTIDHNKKKNSVAATRQL